MSSKPLTKRQKEILTFISDHINNIGFPPTRNELSKHFGFRSPNAAESHLRVLERPTPTCPQQAACVCHCL